MYQNAEEFVCKIYGNKNKNIKSVNKLCGKLFWARLRKNDRVPDLATLPPCSSTLRKHTTHSHYVTKMWRRAGAPLQSLDHFKNYGWLPDGTIDWVDEVLPKNIEALFKESSEKNGETKHIEDDDRELTDEEQDDIHENDEVDVDF